VRIGVVGGGPAGLYFALLMKRQDAGHDVTVVEQNPPDATYGWGVVFSDRALSFLEASDPQSYRDLERRLQTWDD
jgi:anthraniloyl-CoA monooxygenase